MKKIIVKIVLIFCFIFGICCLNNLIVAVQRNDFECVAILSTDDRLICDNIANERTPKQVEHIVQQKNGLDIQTGFTNQRNKQVHAKQRNVETRIISYYIVEGNIAWLDDRQGFSHPCQYTKVEIVDYLTNDVEAEFYTDADGYYREGLGTTCSGSVYFRVYAQGENISVVSSSDDIYIYESEQISLKNTHEDPFNPNVFDILIDMGTTAGQAIQIAQAGIIATRYVKEMNGAYFAPVDIVYPHNEDRAGCFYQSTENRIFICAPSQPTTPSLTPPLRGLEPYSSWDVVMHEYGHHVQECLGITNSPGGTHYLENLINIFDKGHAVRLSWGEAYASVFGSLAQIYFGDELENIRTVGDSWYSSYNTAYFDYETLTFDPGEGNEAAIASVLWDLFDAEGQGSDESFDLISMTHLEHWNMMKNSQAYTMSDFVNYYYNTHTNAEIDNFAKILAEYGFSVNEITVDETDLDPENPPTFEWNSVYTTTRDDIDYYHETFQFIFYDKDFNEVYKTQMLTFSVGNEMDADGKCRYRFNHTEWNSIEALFSGHQYSVAIASWHLGVIGDDDFCFPTGKYISPRVRLTFKKNLDDSFATLSGTNSQTFIIDNEAAPITRYALSATDSVSGSVDYLSILENQNLQADQVKTCKVQILGLHATIADYYVYVTTEDAEYRLEYTAINGIYEVDIAYLYNTFGVTTFRIVQKEDSIVEEIVTDDIRIFIQAEAEEY